MPSTVEKALSKDHDVGEELSTKEYGESETTFPDGTQICIDF
jgi:hypothetical protein